MDFFRKINNAYGSKSKKETTLYEVKKDLENSYEELADYQPDTMIDGVTMPLLVMEPRGVGQEKDRTKVIEAPPGSVFYLGSKIDCFGLKWLVTNINYNYELKLSGEMRLCNLILSFQDQDGNIVNEECVCEKYRTSATGEDAGKVITVDDTRRNILIQFNDETAKILQGRRFYIDLRGVPNPKTYKLTDLDRTSYIYDGRGFFSFVCTEDLTIGDRDRPDIMICDYIEPSDLPLPSIGSCKIVYNGEPLLKCGGSSKVFSAIFMDVEGNLIDNIIPEWSIDPFDLIDSNQIDILSQTGNEINIKANDSASQGTVFILKLSADDAVYGEFENKLSITIGELW